MDPCVWFDADMIETIPSRLSREGWVIPIGRIRGEIRTAVDVMRAL